MKLPLYDTKFKKSGDYDVPAGILLDKPCKGALYDMIKAYNNNQRVGTACTKTRSTMKGTTAKCYRQKGTGRARHGALTTNIFVGGGQTFGPTPRDYTVRLPKKVKQLGLKSALSVRANDNQILIVENIELKEPKTKLAVKAFEALNADSALVVTEGKDEVLCKATRNIPKINTVRRQDLTAFYVIKHDKIIFTKSAWDAWEKSCLPISEKEQV